MSIIPNHQDRQSGVVLVTGLIFILIMTIIGISTLQSSQLENIITRNEQNQTLALNRTEMLLAQGEQDALLISTDGSTLNFSDSSDHFYLNGDIDPTSYHWSFQSAGNSNTGQYAIEYAGKRKLPGASNSMGSSIPGETIYQFMVNAKHELGDGSKRLTQSIFVTEDAP